MLTQNTPIPTLARSKIRSIVKAHNAWQAWYKAKGIESAQATNAQIIEFALQYPSLVATIEMILGQAPQGAPTDSADNMNDNNEGDETTDTVEPDDEGEVFNGPVLPPQPHEESFELDKILSSVDQFLAPLVRSELGKALGPVISKANAGPVEKIVEIERIVEVAPGEKPRVTAPKAKRDKRVPFRTLFPSKKKELWRDNLVTLWTGVQAPAIDPFYVPDHFQMAVMMSAIERSVNGWLTGPSASGKSTLPQQIAAILGRPFVRIGFTGQTEVELLIGSTGLHNGATHWVDGALVKAMREPGTIILLDELTFAPANVQAIIQSIADEHRTITLPTGEVVRAADGVVFIVADNTNGSGDEGGLYAGTEISNVALVTRFGRMLKVDYLTPAREAEAIANHTSCPLAAARHLADFVADCRKLPSLQGVVISLRQMVSFVQTVQDGFNSKEAFEVAISSRMPATERATIEAKADLAWSATFESLVHGKAIPAYPSDSKASKAFAPGNDTY